MYRIFLSSTGKDLVVYRDAAADALVGGNKLPGLDDVFVDRMENWGARDKCPEVFDKEGIEKADLVVFIIGHCYGSSPPSDETSYTELEYEAANKGRLFFLADDDFPVPRSLRENDELQQRQDQFRARILGEDPPPIVAWFENDAGAFATAVANSVSNWVREQEAKRSEVGSTGANEAQQSGPSAPQHLGLFNVPRRPELIGRTEKVKELHGLMAGGGTTAIVPALSGQGGIGKTQLAALYANDYQEHYPGGIFWLNMATPTAESLVATAWRVSS